MQKKKLSLALVIILLTITASPEEAKAQVLEGALIGAGVGAVVGIISYFAKKKPAEKIESPTPTGENQREGKKPLLQSEKVYGIRYQSGSSSALSVAQSFLEKLKQESSIGGYQILDYVYQSDGLSYLRSGFSRGFVFDFKNLKKDPSIHVRVRLIQFPEAKILWEETCQSSDPETCSQNLIGQYLKQKEIL